LENEGSGLEGTGGGGLAGGGVVVWFSCVLVPIVKDGAGGAEGKNSALTSSSEDGG